MTTMTQPDPAEVLAGVLQWARPLPVDETFCLGFCLDRYRLAETEREDVVFCARRVAPIWPLPDGRAPACWDCPTPRTTFEAEGPDGASGPVPDLDLGPCRIGARRFCRTCEGGGVLECLHLRRRAYPPANGAWPLCWDCAFHGG